MKCSVFILSVMLLMSLVLTACSKDEKSKINNEDCNQTCREMMYNCIESLTGDFEASDCISAAGSCYGECLVDSPPKPVENCFTGCAVVNKRCLKNTCDDRACTLACKFVKKACKVKCVRQYRLQQEVRGGAIKPKKN